MQVCTVYYPNLREKKKKKRGIRAEAAFCDWWAAGGVVRKLKATGGREPSPHRCWTVKPRASRHMRSHLSFSLPLSLFLNVLRLTYRTGQDTANCDTCRNSACIIYRWVPPFFFLSCCQCLINAVSNVLFMNLFIYLFMNVFTPLLRHCSIIMTSGE